MFAQLKQVRENVSSLRELIESRGTGQVCVARSLNAAFHAARHAATHADPCMCISLHAYKTCALTQRHPPAHPPTPTHTHMATPLRTQEYVDSLRNTMDTVENDIFVVRQGHHAKFEALSAEEQQLNAAVAAVEAEINEWLSSSGTPPCPFICPLPAPQARACRFTLAAPHTQV